MAAMDVTAAHSSRFHKGPAIDLTSGMLMCGETRMSRFLSSQRVLGLFLLITLLVLSSFRSGIAEASSGQYGIDFCVGFDACVGSQGSVGIGSCIGQSAC